MQPHTGAVLTLISYLTESILENPLSFGGQTFDIKTTIYSSSGSFIYYKYHLVRTVSNNQISRELDFQVGKDYICFLKVRYDSMFEKFEFIKHRHTYVHEEFTLYKDSENFSGSYEDEKRRSHTIKGRKLSKKFLEFYDTFPSDKDPNITKKLKYEILIM
ncbi:MAG: hypothetical protein H6772_01110 [Pseudomonadales bacterium]|nr:hypothetical protein [Pseudomonadales bacterium]